MSLMNYQTAQAYTPPESLALASNVEYAVHYPLGEGAGTSFEDALEDGPTLTLGGTAGGWTNWGVFTPNGSDNRIISPAGNAHLGNLFSWVGLTGKMIMFGMDFQSDGAGGATETLLGWGRNSSTGEGGYFFTCSGTMALSLDVRGKAGASNIGTNISGTAMNNTDRYSVVTAIVGVSAAEVQVYVRQWRHGTGLQPGGASTNINPLGNGTTAPGADPTNGLSLFARGNNTSYDRFMGATAGSNAKAGGFWAARINEIDMSLPDACLLNMVNSRFEFPLVLRA